VGNQFKRVSIDYTIIVVLAVGLFLVLPLPFTRESSFCSQAICRGNEFETVTQHGWYWLGGYHATVEGLLPRSFKELMIYTDKYDSIPGWQIGTLALLSLILAVSLYALVCWLVRRNKSGRISLSDPHEL
jgi:hypothetical protein